jgi:general L-amino acid transport system substrate-binding protein
MRLRMALLCSAVAVLASALLGEPASAGKTLDAVRARGTVKCGVNMGAVGFAAADSTGAVKGFDADFCRAVAAAVFGDASKVTYIAITAASRFPILQSGEVDLLFSQNSLTFTRDTALGLTAGPIYLYDGQGAMVSVKSGIKSIKEMDGASFCLAPGGSSELNLADWFRAHKMSFKPIVIDNAEAARRAFFAGRCDSYSGDQSHLASKRALTPNPQDFVILPEIIAKSPIAPLVRQGDDQWLLIVKWAVYAVILAEEHGIAQANVDDKLARSPSPEVQRLLGKQPELSKKIELRADWGYQIVKQVGNYGEIFERNLGKDSVLRLPRALNRLWTDGGLIYAPLMI